MICEHFHSSWYDVRKMTPIRMGLLGLWNVEPKGERRMENATREDDQPS